MTELKEIESFWFESMGEEGDLMMKKLRWVFSAVASLFAMVFAAGCQETAVPEKTGASGTASASHDHGHDHGHGEGQHSHDHGAGPHGGTLADWGGGKYHVEFTVDHQKQEATVYVLGTDAKSAAPIKTERISLTISDPEFLVDLLPVPLADEKDGLSSRFVGKHEKLGVVQEYAGTLTAEIEGTPYTGDFREQAHDHK